MSGKPIYMAIADELRDLIASGQLAPGDRAPSTNELSHFHSVNPTTSAKALTELLNQGLLEKRRGLGMFVLPTAREHVLATRRKAFRDAFLDPLLHEAKQLGITTEELINMIQKEQNR
ncbi:GntR family transcriptional regulator [Corynebacterium liangguodongii]|uniref:GntR family transcriptional regulator n=1 Tax=Corynebacterium liangguodongii TaxID=2079535 RepID=A0A2S0WCL1_9CORY|nr:GntR family transcriptional regulator [Corynebacterium liangguodongii]AWB83484.1 GntR family transcriptional regulator [Corynebacterium liangguodongii]PWC00427.1 GntR family transcriptional regulator [Corynebacterium liangguodongii]